MLPPGAEAQGDPPPAEAEARRVPWRRRDVAQDPSRGGPRELLPGSGAPSFGVPPSALTAAPAAYQPPRAGVGGAAVAVPPGVNPAPPRDPYAPGPRGSAPLSWPSVAAAVPQPPMLPAPAPPAPAPPAWDDTAYTRPAPATPPAAPPTGYPEAPQQWVPAEGPATFPGATAPFVAMPSVAAPPAPSSPPPWPAPNGGVAAAVSPAPNGGAQSHFPQPGGAPTHAQPMHTVPAQAPAHAAAHVAAHAHPGSAATSHAHGHVRAEAAPQRPRRGRGSGAAAGSAGGRRRTIVIVALVLAVLLAGASAAYFALDAGNGGGGTSAAGNTDPGPVGTVSRFLAGVQEKDYDSAAAEVCPQTGITAAQLGAVFEQQFGDGIDSFQVDQPGQVEAGKPVLVQYQLTVKGQSSRYQASVATQSGQACVTENRRLTG